MIRPSRVGLAVLLALTAIILGCEDEDADPRSADHAVESSDGGAGSDATLDATGDTETVGADVTPGTPTCTIATDGSCQPVTPDTTCDTLRGRAFDMERLRLAGPLVTLACCAARTGAGCVYQNDLFCVQSQGDGGTHLWQTEGDWNTQELEPCGDPALAATVRDVGLCDEADQ